MGGDGHTRGNTRNRNRICIAVLCAIFLIAIVGVPLYFYQRKNQSVQTPCDESLSVPLLNPVHHPNGSVADGNVLYPSGYHFIKNGTTRGCLCVLKPCIRKCCGKEEYFVKVPHSRVRCEKALGPSPFDNFSIPVHKTPGDIVDVDRDHFRILYGDVCLHGKYLVDPKRFPGDQHDLLVDGRLYHADSDSHKDVSQYCLDSMNGSEEIRTFACFPDPAVDDETKIQFILYPIAMIVSIPFLMATIVVYSILPELRNLHGKCLVRQCSCLLITYIGLAIIQLMTDKINNSSCVFLAIMVQFTFLGSFFWLNVMSFDIWWSFSGLRPVKWGLKATEHKKFLLYSLYAWGVPLAIVSITAGIDMIPGIPNSFFKARFGEQRCWFADGIGSFLYFYLPSGIVLVLNCVMFVSIALKLQSHTKNDRDKVRFCLYLRLFILMGLNWILEMMSFFVGGPKSMWYITDLSNLLQGVVIFLFFVCKRDILQKLNKKFFPHQFLFKGKPPELSRSLSSSISMTKTEIDDLALKSLRSSGEHKYEDGLPQVT